MAVRQAVTGIGGVFFKARDPSALAGWYREQLGVPVPAEATYASFAADASGRDASGARLETVWSAFPDDTKYFGDGATGFMINYRVADLDAMLDQLRAVGAWVDDRVDESEFGRFGWAADPEGNRFELWQPPTAGHTDTSPSP